MAADKSESEKPDSGPIRISNGTNGAVNATETANHRSDLGATFDFRSDVTTEPTQAMLDALTLPKEIRFGDDVFREDEITNSLESLIAELTGFSSALLVMSGTMGNQLSIRTHLQAPPHSVVADGRSHVLGWEAGGLASLSGAFAIPVTPANGHHLTLADIKKHTTTSKDIHACPTRLICLENTLAGTILPLSDAHAISTWAHSQNPPIKMHLDGARLWEAISAQATGRDALAQGIKEYCACFDSVSLCFSKGLGAPIGSMIVGSQKFIEDARHKRKALGGGLRQAGFITAPARVAVEQTFLGGLLRGSHERAREVADMWVQRGGKLEKETETNMVWLDLEAAGLGETEDGEGCVKGGGHKGFVEMAIERGVKVMEGRLVVHYQISDKAIFRLALLFDDIFAHSAQNGTAPPSVSKDVKKQAEEITAPEME